MILKDMLEKEAIEAMFTLAKSVKADKTRKTHGPRKKKATSKK